MNKQRLLHKIELSGLVALVGLCGPGYNTYLSVDANPFQSVQVNAKVKPSQTKKTYHDKAKKKIKVLTKTSYYPSGNRKSVLKSRYNKQGLIIHKEVVSYYPNKKKKSKVVYSDYDWYYQSMKDNSKSYTYNQKEVTSYNKQGIPVTFTMILNGYLNNLNPSNWNINYSGTITIKIKNGQLPGSSGTIKVKAFNGVYGQTSFIVDASGNVPTLKIKLYNDRNDYVGTITL